LEEGGTVPRLALVINKAQITKNWGWKS